MNPFNLAPELLQRIFDYFVLSREFKRVMRLRLVSRQFKNYIDDAVFRLRLLSRLVGAPHWVDQLLRHSNWRCSEGWLTYVHSYLAHQAWRERLTTSDVGRVGRAAQALCEQDGDTGREAVLTCLKSLLRLAASHCTRSLLQEPTARPSECSDSDLKADIYVAAVYLGRKAYVERLIAEGIHFCGIAGRPNLKSSVFGDAFRAAGNQGDLEMIRLLLSCVPEYNTAGTLPKSLQQHLLLCASNCGHRAAFHFALDGRPIHLPETEEKRRGNHDVTILEAALSATPWPDNYERAAAILGPHSKMFNPRRNGSLSAWLTRSASSDKVEMVRYFLSKGATPNNANPEGANPHQHPRYRPLLQAIENSNETTTRMLLDAGADPNLHWPAGNCLRAAARKGSIAIAKMLLDHGADVNAGLPPPVVVAVFKEHLDMFRLLREHGASLDTPESGGWAMALARRHGLDSMVDLLLREGVDKDVMLPRVGERDEIYGFL